MQDPLVVFDLGNVLIRIATDWKHACSVAGVSIGSGWPLDETKRAALHDLVVLNEVGRMGHDDFCTKAGEIFGLASQHIAAVSDSYLIAPFDGVDELLDDLAKQHIETACLSNTNASHWNLMLAQAGHAALPMHKLTHRFASQEVGARKPDDAIYKHLEEVTGRTGEQIIFFDDKSENLEAATRRRWKTVLVDPLDANPIPMMRNVLEELRIL